MMTRSWLLRTDGTRKKLEQNYLALQQMKRHCSELLGSECECGNVTELGVTEQCH